VKERNQRLGENALEQFLEVGLSDLIRELDRFKVLISLAHRWFMCVGIKLLLIRQCSIER
jgi:hypothetical protein